MGVTLVRSSLAVACDGIQSYYNRRAKCDNFNKNSQPSPSLLFATKELSDLGKVVSHLYPRRRGSEDN